MRTVSPSPDKQNYGTRLVGDSYPAWAMTADKYFGGICVLSLIIALVDYAQGVTEPRSPILLALFTAANLVISRITVGLETGPRVRLELFRIFVVNNIFAPVLLVFLGGHLKPWWPGFFISGLGAAVMLGATYPARSWKSLLGVLYWGAHQFITGILVLGAGSFSQVALVTGMLLMTSLWLLCLTEGFIETARSENERFEETLAQLQGAQAQLIESGKLSALGQMAGSIAHEINSPLATIQLAVRQIRRATELDSAKPASGAFERKLVLDRVGMIESLIERISRIIGGLRAYCKDSSAEPFRIVTLRDVIDDTLVFCEERCRASRIELKVTGSALDTPFECRPVQISQVLLNLLNNAYDAVRAVGGGEVRIDASDLGDRLSLSVEDSGSGISPEVRMRLFKPFFTTKGDLTGCGLGLSISRRIVESHRGRLELRPDVARTTFEVTLPRAQDPQTA